MKFIYDETTDIMHNLGKIETFKFNFFGDYSTIKLIYSNKSSEEDIYFEFPSEYTKDDRWLIETRLKQLFFEFIELEVKGEKIFRIKSEFDNLIDKMKSKE